MSDEILSLEETVDDLIDPVVDAEPLWRRMDDKTRWALANDIAKKLMPYPVVARRYGFTDDREMADFISRTPMLRAEIKTIRAAFFSEVNMESRLRTLAGASLLAAMPDTSQLMFASDKPMLQLDAMRAHARIAGVDGVPAAVKSADALGTSAEKFSVQIVFASSGKVENISARETPRTIEGEAS